MALLRLAVREPLCLTERDPLCEPTRKKGMRGRALSAMRGRRVISADLRGYAVEGLASPKVNQ